MLSYPAATLRGMGESAVSRSAIADAAELLAQKADVLLERLADRVMTSPAPGSKAWYVQRNTVPNSTKARLLVRIAIAHQAHFDLAEDIERARAAGAEWSEIGEATAMTAQQARRRWAAASPATPQQHDSGQLAIW